MKNLAEEFIKYESMHRNTDKTVISSNVLKYVDKKYPFCEGIQNRELDILAEITGENRQTVWAWANKSRQNVKVPFLKLCKICTLLDVDITEMLEPEGENVTELVFKERENVLNSEQDSEVNIIIHRLDGCEDGLYLTCIGLGILNYYLGTSDFNEAVIKTREIIERNTDKEFEDKKKEDK